MYRVITGDTEIGIFKERSDAEAFAAMKKQQSPNEIYRVESTSVHRSGCLLIGSKAGYNWIRSEKVIPITSDLLPKLPLALRKPLHGVRELVLRDPNRNEFCGYLEKYCEIIFEYDGVAYRISSGFFDCSEEYVGVLYASLLEAILVSAGAEKVFYRGMID